MNNDLPLTVFCFVSFWVVIFSGKTCDFCKFFVQTNLSHFAKWKREIKTFTIHLLNIALENWNYKRQISRFKKQLWSTNSGMNVKIPPNRVHGITQTTVFCWQEFKIEGFCLIIFLFLCVSEMWRSYFILSRYRQKRSY